MLKRRSGLTVMVFEDGAYFPAGNYYIGKTGALTKDVKQAKRFESQEHVDTMIRNRKSCGTWGYDAWTVQ